MNIFLLVDGTYHHIGNISEGFADQFKERMDKGETILALAEVNLYKDSDGDYCMELEDIGEKWRDA